MIKVCHDMQAVSEFMLKPEITRYACEYGSSPEDETFTANGRRGWLGFYHEGEMIGLTKFYLVTGTMGAFHPYILRKHKEKYNGMVRQFFEWFLDDAPEQICKLNVYIPLQFKGAIKAALDVGMTKEGVDRMSYLSKAGPCDRIMLGITRREMIK
jgi:RimJ/RimL family protein N-acetyltransferase